MSTSVRFSLPLLRPRTGPGTLLNRAETTVRQEPHTVTYEIPLTWLVIKTPVLGGVIRGPVMLFPEPSENIVKKNHQERWRIQVSLDSCPDY